MKRFIGLAVVTLTAALPNVAVAQSGKALNPPNQSVQANVKKALEEAGFKDVRVDPGTSVVRAKDPAGSPVMMVIGPDTFASDTEAVRHKSGSAPAGGRSQSGDDERATGSLGDVNGRYELTLTPGQKQKIWDSLSSEKTMRAKRPPTATPPRVGATIPRSVPVQPLPDDITNDIPALTGYHFAVVGNEIVIVSPSSKKVLDIFGEQ
jgi:Protein of unknown function (DUF1236)